jgi:hypothetical protein
MNALAFNSVGNNNTSIGGASLVNTLSSNNTAVGFQAGSFNQSGGFNTFIGSGADVDANGLWTNSSCFGANSKITASNQIVLGTTAETTIVSGKLSVGKATNAYTLDISGSVNFTGSLYKNGSAYTQSMPTDISCNNLTVGTNMFYGANQFRYVPWTVISNNSNYTSLSQILNPLNSDGTLSATPPTTTGTVGTNFSITYSYSVVGNTLYINYCFKGISSAGSVGSGTYGYIIPSPYKLDTSQIISAQPSSYNFQCSQVGVGTAYGGWSSNGNPVVVLKNSAATNKSLYGDGYGYSLGMYIWSQGQFHGSGMGAFNAGVCWSFNCSLPII